MAFRYCSHNRERHNEAERDIEVVEMNWKEFFKPTWKKIALNIVVLYACFFFFLLILQIITDGCNTHEEVSICVSDLLNNGVHGLIDVLTWSIVVLLIIGFGVYLGFGMLVCIAYIALIIVAIIFIPYSISCLIVWIYKKVKNK